MHARIRLFVGVLLLFALPLFAQTTSSLTGTVTTGGQPLGGVTVTVQSPALQGTRSAITGDAGTYTFDALPPGEYQLMFERSGLSIDCPDRFLDAVDFQHRQDWTEYLFLHDRRIVRHVDEDCGCDEEVVAVVLAAMVDFSAAEKARQPVEVTGIHDAAIVRALLRIGAVEAHHSPFQVLEEIACDVLEHQHVIRRGARLPGIHPAALGNATRRHP